MRRRLRAVPRPLALLLPVVALFGVAWALLVPAWGAPDEDAHYGYAETLAQRGALPGDPHRGSSSTDQRLSMLATNTDAVTFFRYAKPEWSQVAQRRWRPAAARARRDDGGGARNQAAAYPPAYYLYEAVPYRIGAAGDTFTRLYLMRVFSVAWLLVTTVGAWLLAGELFGRRRMLQLVAAAVTGLWPMLSFITASVNPDAMLIALWTLATWLAVAIVKRGLNPARAAGLCAAAGVAMVTKATAIGLLPLATFALGYGVWQARDRLRGRFALRTAAGVTGFVAPLAAWYAVARANGRSAYSQATEIAAGGGGGGGGGSGLDLHLLTSYLWQFYLPKLPFQGRVSFVFPVISHYPAYEVWLGSGWAAFGWANVWFPSWVYYLFLAVVIAAAAGLLVTAVRGWRALRGRTRADRLHWWPVAAAILLAFGPLLAGLHWTDYTMLHAKEPPFMQGRYLLPVTAVFAVALTQALRALPRRAQAVAGAALVGGLVVFQITCLGLVASRYYA